MTRVVKYGSKEITVEIKRTKRKKTVALQVVLPSKVIVLSPAFLEEAEINEIIDKRLAWVARKLKDLEEASRLKRHKKEFVSGESFPYLGKHYRLKIIKDNAHKSSTCTLLNGRFYATVDENLDKETAQAFVKEAKVEWYCRQAADKIPKRVERYAKALGRWPERINIRGQKKRWGSCSAKGTINLNWKIIMAPLSVIDYVIVHELCHLAQANHSKQFWELVESMLPDYRTRRGWLKQYAYVMQILD